MNDERNADAEIDKQTYRKRDKQTNIQRERNKQTYRESTNVTRFEISIDTATHIK